MTVMAKGFLQVAEHYAQVEDHGLEERTWPTGANVPPVEPSEVSTAMQDELARLRETPGFEGAAVHDASLMVSLAVVEGDSPFPIHTAAAMNAEVVLAKQRVIRALGQGWIEDMLITLEHEFHLIRPLRHRPSVFVYMAVRREGASLAAVRGALGRAAERLEQLDL